MQWLASEAVDIAEKNYNLDLDYSEESIEDVEIILGKIHDEYLQSKSETGLQGLAMAFGSYIGEVIRHRHAGARWERDHSIMGKESYPIHWQGGQSFPLQWCYKRIMSGPEENVWHKYLALSELRGTDTSREGKVTD